MPTETTLDLTGSRLNFKIPWGRDAIIAFTWRLLPSPGTIVTPENAATFPIVDVAGMFMRIQLKSNPDSDTSLVEYASDGNGIVLTPGSVVDNIVWTIPRADNHDIGVAVVHYDALIKDSLDHDQTVFGGLLNITRSVTRVTPFT